MSAGRFLAERLVDLRRFWREPPILAVIAFNLVPAASVVLFGWSAGLLVIFYWLENVVIGVFNAPKIFLAGTANDRLGEGLFLTPFFALHYGLFTLVHGVFVFLLFGFGDIAGQAHASELWKLLASDAFRWNVVALLGFHLYDFVAWLRSRAYEDVAPGDQMMSVYPRIIILHLTVIGGGFFLMQAGDPIVGVLLIALFKTVFDVVSKARRMAQRAARREHPIG